jgi:hypothetical protein
VGGGNCKELAEQWRQQYKPTPCAESGSSRKQRSRGMMGCSHWQHWVKASWRAASHGLLIGGSCLVGGGVSSALHLLACSSREAGQERQAAGSRSAAAGKED